LKKLSRGFQYYCSIFHANFSNCSMLIYNLVKFMVTYNTACLWKIEKLDHSLMFNLVKSSIMNSPSWTSVLYVNAMYMHRILFQLYIVLTLSSDCHTALHNTTMKVNETGTRNLRNIFLKVCSLVSCDKSAFMHACMHKFWTAVRNYKVLNNLTKVWKSNIPYLSLK
jgi:hypothetical protein